MSLEQALKDNTLVMRELIAAIKEMTNGVELASVAVCEEARTANFIPPGAVYKFGPTEPLNGVQALCEHIDEATYLKLKTEYAALTEAVISNPTQATAAASTQPTAPVVAAPVSAPVTTATPDWAKEVIPALMALAKKPATGQRQVQALLAEFGCAGKTVPAMQGLGKHAEIIASAQRRLTSDEGL